jgi:hypothetical protein
MFKKHTVIINAYLAQQRINGQIKILTEFRTLLVFTNLLLGMSHK